MKLSSPLQAHDERHVLAGADEPALLALVHHDQRVGALELAQRRPDRVGEVALVGLLDEVGDRLGVGLGREHVAAGLEPVAEVAEVLDDPVVDHRDVAGAVLVGMGVEVVRPAVGRPAGVREPDRRVRRPVRDRRLEVGELARLLLDEQVALLVDEGDARRSRSRGIRADGDPRSGWGPPHGARYSRRCRTCAWGVLLGLEIAAPPRLASVVGRLRAPRSRRPARRPGPRPGPRPSPAARVRCPRDGRGPGRAARGGARRRRSTRPRTSSASHWSRWRTRIARCCWGRSGTAVASSAMPAPRRRHHPQQLDRGHDPVARRACARG